MTVTFLCSWLCINPCSQTRIQQRRLRPGAEFCHDEVSKGKNTKGRVLTLLEEVVFKHFPRQINLHSTWLHCLQCTWPSYVTAGGRHFTDRAAQSLRPDQQAGRGARAGGMQINITFLSPSGDLGIGLVWDNHPHRTGPDHPLFGPTVEILFKLN